MRTSPGSMVRLSHSHSDDNVESERQDRGAPPVRGYAVRARDVGPPMLTTPPVDGIVLAAGRSARMGRPKPLLRVDGETFMERAVRRLAAGGCRAVSVVVRADDAPVQRLARAVGAALVLNPHPASEQIDSLRLAVESLAPDTGAVVVVPVDFPLISAATVNALITSFHTRRVPAIVPIYHDAMGHPVLLARSTFDAVVKETWPEGLRSLLDSFADRIVRLPVEDPAILTDVDTPEQYAALAGAEPAETDARS